MKERPVFDHVAREDGQITLGQLSQQEPQSLYDTVEALRHEYFVGNYTLPFDGNAPDLVIRKPKHEPVELHEGEVQNLHYSDKGSHFAAGQYHKDMAKLGRQLGFDVGKGEVEYIQRRSMRRTPKNGK